MCCVLAHAITIVSSFTMWTIRFRKEKSSRQIGAMCVRRKWEMKINSKTPSNFYRMDSGLGACFFVKFNSYLIRWWKSQSKQNQNETCMSDAFQQWVSEHTRPFNFKLKQIPFFRDVGENRATCTWFIPPDKFYLLGNVLNRARFAPKIFLQSQKNQRNRVQHSLCGV